MNKIVEKFRNDDVKVAVVYMVYVVTTSIVTYIVSEKVGRIVMKKIVKLIKKGDDEQ